MVLTSKFSTGHTPSVSTGMLGASLNFMVEPTAERKEALVAVRSVDDRFTAYIQRHDTHSAAAAKPATPASRKQPGSGF